LRLVSDEQLDVSVKSDSEHSIDWHARLVIDSAAMPEQVKQTDPTPLEPALELRTALERQWAACELERPPAPDCYEPGQQLRYEITGVFPAKTGHVALEVERFVGGGFAGQVYQVRLLELDGEIVAGLTPGQHYAVKILKPPTRLKQSFRNLLFLLAYQAPFAAQANPAAVRAGVLWHKLIRHMAAHRFGDPTAVCDTYATFYDAHQRSYGEINEWVDGRIWKFEVDERLFDRFAFEGESPADCASPEYVSKKLYLQRLVALLHEMGAPELARQYEWWTCKSQPNVLKRLSHDAVPSAGLCAIDFRAGLTLLPLLPMSPIDPWLICKGLLRGRIVQLERSDPQRRDRFFAEHQSELAGLEPAIEELVEQEQRYRSSIPDLSHHRLRLLLDHDLRSSVMSGLVTAWHNAGLIDVGHARRLGTRRWLLALLAAVFVVPLVGRRVLKLWGDQPTRRHLKRCLTSWRYLGRAVRGGRLVTLRRWLTAERLDLEHLQTLFERPARYYLERWTVSWLPASWHRGLTEPAWAWAKLKDSVKQALDFLRIPAERERRLLEQVQLGAEEGMLTADERERIEREIKDPYIQKYLRCLAVHLCTVPITQLVMVIAGVAVAAYCLLSRQLSWAESVALGSATAATIQLLPISPGSLTRGFFVLYLMVRERDVRNYYIAAPVSFLHVIGYLAFPLQMVAHNPALARFLAGRWTRNLAHLVPVFGEQGGLLEHAVFDTFFNLPLSLKRRFIERPVTSALKAALLAALLALSGTGLWARVWEIHQPRLQLEAVTVLATRPYYTNGIELHWSLTGTRVRLAGVEGPVDFANQRWDPSLEAGDTVDVVLRKSFFGDEYDGLAVSRTSPSSSSTP